MTNIGDIQRLRRHWRCSSPRTESSRKKVKDGIVIVLTPCSSPECIFDLYLIIPVSWSSQSARSERLRLATRRCLSLVT